MKPPSNDDLLVADREKAKASRRMDISHIGEMGQFDIHMRVYVRSAKGKELPTQRDVENKVSDLFLFAPRLDEGVDWDASATIVLSPEPDEENQDEHGQP